MAIDRDTPLSREELKFLQEEMFRNYRIRNTHQKALMHNAQWMYAEMINCSVGFCYEGDTAGDYFQPAVASYTQTNSLDRLDLSAFTDMLVPLKEDSNGQKVAVLHIFGKNVDVRASSHSQTWVLSASAGTSYGWVHGVASKTIASDTPVEWYYEARASQANPEDGTDRLIAAMITEWRITTADMP